MTAIELLRQGISTQNWDDIKKVYAMFTGETVTFDEPKPTKKKPKKLKKIEPIEEAPIQNDEYDVSNFIMQRGEVDRTNSEGKTPTRKEPINTQKIKAVGNMFTDDFDIAIGDIAIDRKIVHQKIQKRPPPQQKIYVCSGTCNRKFKLYPSQTVQGKYKCAECIKATGH